MSSVTSVNANVSSMMVGWRVDGFIAQEHVFLRKTTIRQNNQGV
ncbi:hypothetical protein [Planktotalea arctica]